MLEDSRLNANVSAVDFVADSNDNNNIVIDGDNNVHNVDGWIQTHPTHSNSPSSICIIIIIMLKWLRWVQWGSMQNNTIQDRSSQSAMLK